MNYSTKQLERIYVKQSKYRDVYSQMIRLSHRYKQKMLDWQDTGDEAIGKESDELFEKLQDIQKHLHNLKQDILEAWQQTRDKWERDPLPDHRDYGSYTQ